MGVRRATPRGGVRGWLDQEDILPLSKAARHFSGKIERNPEDTAWRYARALVFREQGDIARAIEDLSALIQLKPKEDAYLIARGTAWQDSGEYEKADADYREARRLRPKRNNPPTGRPRAA